MRAGARAQAGGDLLPETSARGLAETLGLPAPPRRIEVYDNSHIMGTNAVGAMIVAGPEGFVKNQYRKFNIRTEGIPRRRFRHDARGHAAPFLPPPEGSWRSGTRD
jgi:excinuclease UvrABC nuclease subunit